MLEIALYLAALIALVAGSFCDLKKNEVPYWISYSFLFSMLGIRMIYSIISSDFSIIIQGISGSAVFFASAYLFYKASQWGGGDVMIAAGIGALLGLNFDLFLFLALLIFTGAIYGILWSVYLAVKNKKKFTQKFKILFKEMKLIFLSCLFLLIASSVSFLISDSELIFFFFILSFILFIGIALFIFIKAIEDACLLKQIKSSQLTEGDWVAETIKINNRVIISKNKAISIEQIKKLKNYRRQILIKTGIPFIPAFLLAFIAFILLKKYMVGLF